MARDRLVGMKVAVTGGAQGIGRSLAESLVARGASVAIGDVQHELAQATAQQIGHGTVAIALDVTDPASFASYLDEAAAALGGLDALVNNAGIMPIGALLDETDTVTDRAVDIDLRGVLTGTKLAGRRFAADGGGHIVNIASLLGTLASPNAATYCATKYAVVGLGHSLRQEWRGNGVAISTICPGFVRTELIAGMAPPKIFEPLLMVDPQDVADAVVETLAQGRSRTVAVPKVAGAISKASGNLPIPVRDWLFRVSGGNKVTTDLDTSARSGYQEKIDGTAESITARAQQQTRAKKASS